MEQHNALSKLCCNSNESVEDLITPQIETAELIEPKRIHCANVMSVDELDGEVEEALTFIADIDLNVVVCGAILPVSGLTPEQLIKLRKQDITTAERTAVLKIVCAASLSSEVVVAAQFNIEMTEAKMACLRPGTWLNDEVVNYYMCLLQQRDKILHPQDSYDLCNLASHYFSSFFIAKLFCDKGVYDYAQVARWSKKFDVFEKQKVLIPLHLSHQLHWVMMVIFIQKKEIHFYDSMSGNGHQYLHVVLKWLVDEALSKKQTVLDPAEWKLIDEEHDVPQQQNGYDCGVFTIMCADHLSDNLPISSYRQSEMPANRIKIGAAIIRGHLLY